VFTVVVAGVALVEDEPPQALTSATQASAVAATVATRAARSAGGVSEVGGLRCMRAY
jgi:hypothetical protein